MSSKVRWAALIPLALLVITAGCPEDGSDDPLLPVPDFEATPLSGTQPLTVFFTNLTQGAYAAVCWDFGDGCESTERDPAHVYQNPGVYTVTLTLYDDAYFILAFETKEDYVTVNHAGPVAQFSAAPLCAYPGDSISFVDESLGEATSWAWDFGDSTISTLQSPVHQYAQAGTYDVQLAVTGPGGSDTKVRPGYIRIVASGSPIPAFTGSPRLIVTGSSVNFTDLSTGAASSWSWTFGDGGTSTDQHPSHTYTQSGRYTVALTASNPSGSNTETKTDYVTVNNPAPPTAEFSASPTLLYAGNPVQFTDLSTGSFYGWSWNFGDGGTAADRNPSHTYAATGSYTVSLTVTGYGGSDTETKANYVVVVQVGGPQAAFSGTPTSVAVGGTVAFTDASTGPISTWSWSFGDGSTSTQQNPSHAYNSTGFYTVTLVVNGSSGSDTETKTNYIAVGQPAPVAGFSGTPLAGQVPSLTVTFTDQSIGTVTSWLWTFGDGSTSTLQNPVHTYNSSQATSFTVSLTAANAAGSNTCTKVNYVSLTPIPTPPPKPVIYLYRPIPAWDTVTVIIDGTATKTIPEIPLGSVITWTNVLVKDGKVWYEGQEYPYLFYESETWRRITAHRGWIMSRDQGGNLFLDGSPVTLAGLGSHFSAEMRKAGFFENEIRDFVDFWFGPDEKGFFGLGEFTLAVKYFPIDQLEALHRIVTEKEYKSVVRVSFLVEFAEPGTVLQKPVYPVPQPGDTIMHEWAYIPHGELAKLYLGR